MNNKNALTWKICFILKNFPLDSLLFLETHTPKPVHHTYFKLLTFLKLL